MILRRLAEQLREQNWTAITIEFVLLVVGVFLGIQVANWNETRLDDQRARAYLERLSSDLDEELNAIDKRVEYVGRSLRDGEAALEWAEDGKLIDDSAWQTVLAFIHASRILPYSPADGTYQEMRSTGELGLVRNVGLRTALTDYYVTGTYARADYILRLNPDYRTRVRGLTPLRVSRHIFAQCFDLASVTHAICESPIDEAAAQDLLRRFAEHPTLMQELAFWADSARLQVEILRLMRTQCVGLKRRVVAELGATQ